MKFTYEGSVTITVSKKDCNLIEISVSDTGIGMTSRALHKVLTDSKINDENSLFLAKPDSASA